ncbi:alginate O-acetyltransferase AlgX-related protein [Algoriphagus antarcticus]|uniref:Acetyltransferase AlgX (SGNH hydrolase-like protein) n=1 Tax=Algoriphagus antarcticus TaxID=238540 RepID=A0A3E0E2F1_9BACT|nr:hypothetical protein [Algoriphagus antarcticus]REG91509.1 acetyltransferase AlgX (SGNH hydrolase-like protein) [Algoriphagus antarcticus]
MKRFFIKLLALAIPFGILLIITYLNYESEKGDLIRIGYIPNSFPDYRNKFESELSRKISFDKLSSDSINREYDVLTIGDSFSEQGAAGYQNYLASIYGKSVLHLDNSLHSNPFQVLISLKNGGFFEEFKIKNVILEVVERHFIENFMQLKIDSSINYKSFNPVLKNNLGGEEMSQLSNRILKFPYYAINRKLYPKELVSLVYARKLKNKPFSVAENTLYFYHLDVANIALNNSMDKLQNINNVLNDFNNKLENSGVNLIVFPVPDKYHFYKDDLEDTDGFVKPLLFSNYAKLNKEYAFLDLLDAQENQEFNILDFYYYDDSHWSPEGSKVVAEQLVELVEN